MRRSLVRLTSGFCLSGFIDALWLRLRGRELLVTGHCNCCGACCRQLSLHGADGWMRREEEFAALLRRSPEYRRFRLLGRDDEGFLLFDCTWCGDDGLCRDYDNRLPLCRSFPEKNLRFCGGSLPAGCGFRFSEVRPFRGVLAKAVEQQHNKR